MPKTTYPEDLDQRLGDVIRQFREFYQMTQVELAKKVGVTQAYISQLENGQRNSKVAITTLRGIAMALEFESLSAMIEVAEGIPRDALLTRMDSFIEELDEQLEGYPAGVQAPNTDLVVRENRRTYNRPSKFDKAIAAAKAQMKKQRIACDDQLVEAIARGLGPALYNRDARLVSTSQKSELETIKQSFLIRKLGAPDGPELDRAMQNAIRKIGPSNRNKQRSVFYYLLVKELGLESKLV